MCRMMGIVAPAGLDPQLLARFRKQARGKIAGDDPRGHPDGWGVTHLNGGTQRHEGRAAYLGRSTGDALTDPAYDDMLSAAAKTCPEGIILAHVRAASAGGVTLDNTHPFVDGNWAFCHNGTVHDLAPPGESDSRAMFAFLLREIRGGANALDALRALVREVEGRKKYSSMTCLLTDGETLWGLRKVGTFDEDCAGNVCDPTFYTLGSARIGDATVLSQEHEFLGLGVSDWTPIPDGHVAVADASGVRVLPL